MGRRSVWSDPRVIELSASFVTAADETWRLQRGDDAECRFFQDMVAGGGHYRGKGGTRQGIYVCAPSGELLASLNSSSAERVVEALELGLERWGALPAERRALPQDAPIRPAHRWEQSYPADGLVLTSVRRDLPEEDNPFAPRAERWNRDPVWFSRDESAGWLPAELEVGAARAVDARVVRRLARFHLVDNARGQTLPYAPDEVQGAIEARVVSVDGARVELELAGTTQAASDGVWRLGDNDWRPRAPGPFPRSMRTRCEGAATWDRAQGRFVAFELVAVGTRTGRTPNNGRRGGAAEGRIGFVFQLDTTDRRVPPSFVDLYDAPWIRRPGE